MQIAWDPGQEETRGGNRIAWMSKRGDFRKRSLLLTIYCGYTEALGSALPPPN